MWARTRLDIGFADLAAGLGHSVLRHDRDAATRRVERYFGSDDALVCYSVRSGFDLALQALAFPAGSEILFSALNIKGMVKIVRRLEMTPVPLDMEFATMRPSVETIERAISPRTKAIVVAPLFGTRYDFDPIIAVARKHGLVVFEDCAQAFNGREFSGTEGADLSMFSFGPLKFATALGGAVFRVRDAALRERMRAIQAAYPIAGRAEYALRLVKFGALKLLTSRLVLGLVARFYRLRGLDYEDSVSDAVRGVAKLGSAKRIRKQCSTPMLFMLVRRLENFTERTLDPRRHHGRRLLELLGDGVSIPALANEKHNFWTFPVVADRPDDLMNELRREGFDAATLRRSEAVPEPEDRPELEPVIAKDLIKRLVVVPCYPAMSDRDLARQAAIIRRATAADATN